MKRPAVFLDRDGTINEQMGYINHLSRFRLLPGACEAIALLNRKNFRAIVVSNQSGVARGYFPIELVHDVHRELKAALREYQAFVDAIFFCPHHPRGLLPEYRCDCDCRKPRTGLIDQAQQRFDIDMSKSYVVGDRYVDIELAHRTGLKGVMVKTGYGRGELSYVLPDKSREPDYVARDLLHAVQWIVENVKPS